DRLVLWSGRDLRSPRLPCVLVDEQHVGEGSPDVDSDPIGHWLPLFQMIPSASSSAICSAVSPSSPRYTEWLSSPRSRPTCRTRPGVDDRRGNTFCMAMSRPRVRDATDTMA